MLLCDHVLYLFGLGFIILVHTRIKIERYWLKFLDYLLVIHYVFEVGGNLRGCGALKYLTDCALLVINYEHLALVFSAVAPLINN